MLIAAPGSATEHEGKQMMANNTANGIATTNHEAPTTRAWSAFGKRSSSPGRAYKPVTFSPLSSSSSSSVSSSSTTTSSSSVSNPVMKSSCVWSPSASKVTPTPAVTAPVPNGVMSEVAVSVLTESSSEEGKPPAASDVMLPSSATDDKPKMYNLKPVTAASSGAIWKPPSSSISTLKSSAIVADLIQPPVVVDFLKSSSTQPNQATFASETKSWKPLVNNDVTKRMTIPRDESSKTATDWMNLNGTESRATENLSRTLKSNRTGVAKQPIDPTVFDEELNEDWWDSLFRDAQKMEADAAAAAVAAPAAVTVAESRSDKATGVGNSITLPQLSNTAAVLRLSSSLGGAIQNAVDAEPVKNSEMSRTNFTVQNRGPKRPVQNDILQEWRSGFYSDATGTDNRAHQGYDHFKEVRGVRLEPVHNEDEAAAAKPGTDGDRSDVSRNAMTEKVDDRSRKEKLNSAWTPVPVKFEGIGPMEEKTGVPIATRPSIDENHRKDWYKRMYASLHKPDRPPTAAKPMILNGELKKIRSPSPSGGSHPSYYPPHAKYNPQRYRNQPLRIEDYEPGYHSSIALKDLERNQNRSFESDAEVDYRNDNMDPSAEIHSSQVTGTRRRIASTGGRSESLNRKTARQKRDEENMQRKQDIEAALAQERRRKFAVEQKDNEARRHKDLYTPNQKTTFLLNRFNEYEIGGIIGQHPTRMKETRLRGKAKALYSFKAQNNTELSFKKGDIIYLLRKVDKNWYQGEHNCIVGIFPIAYVQVITSLEEAKAMAFQREGKAVAKFDFKAKTSAELSVQKGDVVTLIRRVDQNWYEARTANHQGIIPVSFVETVHEPDTPLNTPMTSTAPTPLPNVSGPLSPTSSIHSGGPEVPSAPMSPWNSDFYESEFEPELREITSKALSKPRNSSSNTKSDAIIQKSNSLPRTGAAPNFTKAATYYTLPPLAAGTKPSDLWASLFEKPKKNATDEKDLFVLARKRRTNSGSDLEARSASLGDDLEKITRPTTHTPLGKSQSFDFGQRDKLSKGTNSKYSRFVAIYDYKPKNIDELELKEGEIVSVMEKCDDGWYVGFSETTDQFGSFPGNYVEPVS